MSLEYGELTSYTLRQVRSMKPAERERAARKFRSRRKRWVPNEGPQTEAYFSEADVLLYGGEPGGGKSQLILGLAFNEHERSLVMRRRYGDLDRLVEDALKIHGSRVGFNGSPPPKLTISDRQVIDFAAAHRVGDEQGQMGKGRDLIGVDEATHFAYSQIRFLMGWNRTESPKQRCRVVLATNPPLSPEGMWIVEMFAPWLDPHYPHPARPGELRWVVSDEDGNDRWVDGPGEYEVVVAGKPKMVQAMSRTYVPASVKDNPYYVASGYEKQLDAMPEPYRSLLRGGFRTEFQDQENQAIPTAWIREAQARWKEKAPLGVPMCAIGVDASGGGTDPMMLAIRHDGWFAPLIEVPAKDIPRERAGKFSAGIIISYRRDQCGVIVDLGGGYGGSIYEQLHENEIDVRGFKGSEASTRRTEDKLLGFRNKRTEAYWKFREALDPSQPGGSPIALPDDPALVADLAAPTFTVQGKTLIELETKEKVCDRLGRSTDRGDAVVMAWSYGPTFITDGEGWRKAAAGRRKGRGFGGRPQVQMSERQRYARRR